tara:strand:+ start:3931 stop:4404 length:474 start_codon:yes stop_codon:yes gene_type:complete
MDPRSEFSDLFFCARSESPKDLQGHRIESGRCSLCIQAKPSDISWLEALFCICPVKESLSMVELCVSLQHLLHGLFQCFSETFSFSSVQFELRPIVSNLSGYAISVIAMDETQVKVLLQEAEEHLKVMSCRSSSDAFDVRLPRNNRENWSKRSDRAA